MLEGFQLGEEHSNVPRGGFLFFIGQPPTCCRFKIGYVLENVKVAQIKKLKKQSAFIFEF